MESIGKEVFITTGIHSLKKGTIIYEYYYHPVHKFYLMENKAGLQKMYLVIPHFDQKSKPTPVELRDTEVRFIS
jgi:hypothetical protein